MTPIFPQLPVALGTYKLTRMLGILADSDLYIAEQSHVDRLVVLEVMRPSRDTGTQRRFVENARARVTTELPHTAQVLDSTQTKGYWHITHELPKGRNLAALLTEGATLTPMIVCRLIRNVAELYAACQAAGNAADTLDLGMVFITKAGEATCLSPIIAEVAGDEVAVATQMATIAGLLQPLLPSQGPGRSRVATLLSWMQEGFEGQLLDWGAIATTAGQIIKQLESASLKVAPPPAYDVGKLERQGKKEKKNRRSSIVFTVLAIAAIVGMGTLGASFGPDKNAYRSPVEEGIVRCLINGETSHMQARPVTIGEYRKFLRELGKLSAGKIARINSGMPPEATEHEPADWEAMVRAATQKGEWNGRQLKLSSPVTNVSYWDALAYSRYAGGRLPGAEALQAVLRLEETKDTGIDEWTASQNKAHGPYAAGHIVLPGSGTGPYATDKPGERSPKRGFRIILPH